MATAKPKFAHPGWLIPPLVLVLIVFYWPFLSGSACYFFRDIPHYIEPFSRFTGQAMRHGKLPLWNPFCYCGMSQIAITIQSIVYPPIWLFSFMAFSQALAANMIIHQILAFIGGYLLIAGFGWGALPAAAAGVTLALCGYMFSLSGNFSLVIAASWCPITLWSFLEICKRPAKLEQADETEQLKCCPAPSMVRKTAVAALCFTGLIFAGHAELGLIECALLAGLIGWTTWRGWREKSTGAFQPLMWSARAVALGTLLAMPLLLPAVEWLGVSRRAGGLPAEETFLLSANWYDFLCLILPQPLGDLQQRWAQFRQLVMPGSMVTYLPAAFVGPIIFTCALWSLADRSWRHRWLAVALLVLSLAIAFGGNTPLAPFLWKMIPALTVMRFPIKLLFFTVLVLIVLGARGLYAYERGQAGVLLSLWVWLAAAAVSALLLSGVHLTDALASFTPLSADMQKLARQAEIPLGSSALQASAIGIAVCLVAWVGQRLSQQATAAAAKLIVVAASITMLCYAANFCRVGAPPDFFKQPSLAAVEIDKLRQKDNDNGNSRIIGLYLERFSPPFNYLGSQPRQATIRLFQYSRQLLRPNSNIDFAELSAFGFEGTPTGDYYNFWINCYVKSSQLMGADLSKASDTALARLCQATAVRYAITQMYRFDNSGKPVAVPLLDDRFFHLSYQSLPMNVRIYSVGDCLPRAYFTDKFTFVDTHDAVINQMFDPTTSGFNPAISTILEAANTGSTALSSAAGAGHSAMAVQFLENGFDDVKLKVDAPQAGYVVLADQYYPGWLAYVDDKQTPIMIANCFMRAVAVPAGRHIVHFAYWPRTLSVGLLLFVLAIAWLAYLFYTARYRPPSTAIGQEATESKS